MWYGGKIWKNRRYLRIYHTFKSSMKRVLSATCLHISTQVPVLFAPGLCLKLHSVCVHSLNYPLNYFEIPMGIQKQSKATFRFYLFLQGAKVRLWNVSKHKFLTHISKRCWAVIMSCILPFEPPLFLYFIYLIQIFEVNNGFNVGLIAIKLIWPLWYLLGIAFSFHTVIYLFISFKLHFPTIFLFCLKQNFL